MTNSLSISIGDSFITLSMFNRWMMIVGLLTSLLTISVFADDPISRHALGQSLQSAVNTSPMQLLLKGAVVTHTGNQTVEEPEDRRALSTKVGPFQYKWVGSRIGKLVEGDASLESLDLAIGRFTPSQRSTQQTPTHVR